MKKKKPTSKSPFRLNTERSTMYNLSEELADYFTTVSRKLTPKLGGKSADYEGFCFIARDRKTQKIRAHLSMHMRNDRVSTTYNGDDVEDLERFAHAWANHTYINKMVSVK
jgi:hypothetical protein